MLLRKKADPLAKNKAGKTPADVATPAVKALLQRAPEGGGDGAAEDAAGAQEEAQAEEAAAVQLGPQPKPAAVAQPAAPKRSSAHAAIPAAADDDATCGAKRQKVALSFDDGGDDDFAE